MTTMTKEGKKKENFMAPHHTHIVDLHNIHNERSDRSDNNIYTYNS